MIERAVSNMNSKIENGYSGSGVAVIVSSLVSQLCMHGAVG
jgi:hypothetical protein